MSSQTPLDGALSSLDRLRKALAKGGQVLVRNRKDTSLAKATALFWFQSVKPALTAPAPKEIDTGFTQILEFSDRAVQRNKYQKAIKSLRATILAERSRVIAADPAPEGAPPDFSPLIPDARMQEILSRRWRETRLCIGAGAHLAATVMMGGLLEGLLLARVNALSDRKPVFTASASPKDKAGKTRPLKEWGLKDYLDVALELGWIVHSANTVGAVLRDYRNYIHPEKEFSHGVVLGASDSEMMWAVFATLTKQIVAGATATAGTKIRSSLSATPKTP